MKDLPRDVIQARLQLAEVLDEYLTAGDYQTVGEAIRLVRQDLRLMSSCARRMAAEHGDTIPPINPPRREPGSDERLAEALAQIEAAMQMGKERRTRREAGENITFLADQRDKRLERERRKPKPGLML